MTGLERLGELCRQQLELEQQIHEQVGDLVAQGASWADVGRALRISRQGARQRYAQLEPPRQSGLV